MLGLDELDRLESLLQREMPNRWTEVITRLNRTGELSQLVDLLGISSKVKAVDDYTPLRSGKILVIGGSNVKEKELYAIGRDLGIEKSRFELYLDYKEIQKFNFRKIQYQPKYSLVLVGPMPHSTTGKGDFDSTITALECEPGYPPVIRLGKNQLKISKSDLKDKLHYAIERGLIVT